ncbi:hypothetical protein JCM10908_001629 [Rhodotorula pacifica]|uniref:origin recognition complex subunit 2 n=1 Tax=Rhodotorula pacifica TaxID=1495444 RepID=UPI00316E44A4
MPPRKARSTASKATTPKSSPSKPSAKAKGKRKASDVGAAPSPSPARRRPRVAAPNAGSGDDSDGEDAYRDDDDAPATFLTASSGDVYMLYSTQTSRTTDALLSTAVDPAFTLASYTAALRNYDTLAPPELAQEREARLDKARSRFTRWTFDLEEGFNVLVTGVGSKRRILNEYAERARGRGDVVVVNGYDTAATLVDLVAALEDVVRARGVRQDEHEIEQDSPRKRRSPTKGRARANQASGGTYATARPVSAIESRVRRLCSSLRAAGSGSTSSSRPIYVILHSLDGPVLRLPKNISLLALLAAQPQIHLVASVDHVRSSLMFPTALATARPPFASSSNSPAAAATTTSSSDLADLQLSYRAFTWIHYDCSTLIPYDVEVASLGTLSTLFPPSVYPPLSNSLDPTAASLAQSATHVLASVTDRARRLFNLLGQEQVRIAESLPREVERGMRLLGHGGAGQAGGAAGGGAAAEKAPVVAVSLASLKEKATDALIATHPDQVDGFLSEFKDHGVVRNSNLAPDKVEGVNDDDEDEQEDRAAGQEGGEWVWIPLAREALEEVLLELGIDE